MSISISIISDKTTACFPNSRIKLLYSCLLVVGLSAVASAEGVAGSPFASGKWVKVAIQKSGVYRVSYEALRKAGFTKYSNLSSKTF